MLPLISLACRLLVMCLLAASEGRIRSVIFIQQKLEQEMGMNYLWGWLHIFLTGKN